MRTTPSRRCARQAGRAPSETSASRWVRLGQPNAGTDQIASRAVGSPLTLARVTEFHQRVDHPRYHLVATRLPLGSLADWFPRFIGFVPRQVLEQQGYRQSCEVRGRRWAVPSHREDRCARSHVQADSRGNRAEGCEWFGDHHCVLCPAPCVLRLALHVLRSARRGRAFRILTMFSSRCSTKPRNSSCTTSPGGCSSTRPRSCSPKRDSSRASSRISQRPRRQRCSSAMLQRWVRARVRVRATCLA